MVLSFFLVGFIALFFPVILAGVVAYLARAKISRPWWFLLSAAVVLSCIDVVITDYCRAPLVVTLPSGGGDYSKSSDWSNVLALIPLWKPLSLLMVVSMPVLAGLLRLFRRPASTTG